MPPGLLIKDAVEKYVVRAVAGKFLPPDVVNREKFGFVAPGTPYLLSKQLDWVNEILSPATIRRQGFFNPDTIQRLRTANARDGASIDTTFSMDVLMIVLTFVVSSGGVRCERPVRGPPIAILIFPPRSWGSQN